MNYFILFNTVCERPLNHLEFQTRAELDEYAKVHDIHLSPWTGETQENTHHFWSNELPLHAPTLFRTPDMPLGQLGIIHDWFGHVLPTGGIYPTVTLENGETFDITDYRYLHLITPAYFQHLKTHPLELTPA